MIRGLIETPSVSSVDPTLDMGNGAVIDLLAGWLDDLGFHVSCQPVGETPRKANLIATLGTGDDGLVLAGHVDTVPWDDGRWNHDPFRLTEADGLLYGLGTSDMKAFLALAIHAAIEVDPRHLRRPLTILATADEETSMTGARALADAGRRLGRFAVIGEPTGLRPVHTHKGIMMEAVHVHGRSGHSSDPALGASALEGMHRVIGGLLSLRDELQARYRHDAFHVPFPTMNLGHVHGGDNPNRICAECELHLDLRPLPGMALEDMRGRIHEAAREALRDTGLRVGFRTLFEGVPALETPADSPVVEAAVRLSGRPAGSVAFGTEGPYFSALGMESVILGPGDVDQAHQPDEYLDAARIQPTLNLLRGLIREFCLGASPPAPGVGKAPPGT